MRGVTQTGNLDFSFLEIYSQKVSRNGPTQSRLSVGAFYSIDFPTELTNNVFLSLHYSSSVFGSLRNTVALCFLAL